MLLYNLLCFISVLGFWRVFRYWPRSSLGVIW